jgi:hypothetical protein
LGQDYKQPLHYLRQIYLKGSSRQNLLLIAENNSMNQKISTFSDEIMLKEGIPSLTIPSHEHEYVLILFVKYLVEVFFI